MTEQLAARLSALEAEDALLNAVIESLDEGIIAVSARGQVVRLNESARRLMSLDARRFPSPPICCRTNDCVREAVRGAMNGVATEPSELALGDRTLAHHGASAARWRRRARRHGSHDAPPARDDSPRLRGERVARAQDAAHRDRRLRRDAARSRLCRRRIAAVPRDDRSEHATHAAHRRRPARPLALRIGRLGAERHVERSRRHRLRRVHRGSTHGRREGADAAFQGNARRVDADPTALRQILANLVENAVRHTARGSITVRADPAPEAERRSP